MDLSETLNADFIDAQYEKWKADPNAVSTDWRFFFEGFELAGGQYRKVAPVWDEEQALRQSSVHALISRYRNIGHLLACLDPLTSCPTDHPLLNLAAFNLTVEDLDTLFYAHNFFKSNRASLRNLINILKETYCRSIGVEFMHLQDPDERRWLQDRMEPVRNRPDLSPEDKLRILGKLYESALFEQFLHKTYLGQTRFSLEVLKRLFPCLIFLSVWPDSMGTVK